MSNPLVANAILFPVFVTPYFAGIAQPCAVIAALSSELAVFKLLNSKTDIDSLIEVLFLANLASFVAGVALALVLPFGHGVKGDRFAPSESYGTLVVASFAVGLVMSIVVEWVVIWGLRRRWGLRRPFVSCLLGNMVSYVVLGLVLAESVW
jgi:hypothetical protein